MIFRNCPFFPHHLTPPPKNGFWGAQTDTGNLLIVLKHVHIGHWRYPESLNTFKIFDPNPLVAWSWSASYLSCFLILVFFLPDTSSDMAEKKVAWWSFQARRYSSVISVSSLPLCDVWSLCMIRLRAWSAADWAGGLCVHMNQALMLLWCQAPVSSSRDGKYHTD